MGREGRKEGIQPPSHQGHVQDRLCGTGIPSLTAVSTWIVLSNTRSQVNRGTAVMPLSFFSLLKRKRKDMAAAVNSVQTSFRENTVVPSDAACRGVRKGRDRDSTRMPSDGYLSCSQRPLLRSVEQERKRSKLRLHRMVLARNFDLFDDRPADVGHVL